MKRFISALILFASLSAIAQTDNTFYAKQFPGTDVGSKVTAAMNACSSNALLQCYLVIDSSLAAYAPGTLPVLCNHCWLLDYRNGFPFNGTPLGLPGADIGAKINAFGPDGTLTIPNGVYNYSTTINLTQAPNQHLRLICQSRSTVLNYTGTGDAIYITAGGDPNAIVDIENCTINGTAAATNGIDAFHAQNLRLINNAIGGFTNGAGIFGHGLLDSVLSGNDLIGNLNNLYFAPDTADSFASNENHVYGGSLQYATNLNYWDEGNHSVYGGDTGNVLDGVTMEQNINNTQFVIEGTWNDAIKNGYIEYIDFPYSTGTLYLGVIGNQSSSGYGSDTTQSADNFQFLNNYLITPNGCNPVRCPSASAYTTASLYVFNSFALHVDGVADQGAPTYGIVFLSGGSNLRAVVGPADIEWQTSMYQNPPADAFLWVQGGQAIPNAGWQTSSAGIAFNQLLLPYIAPGSGTDCLYISAGGALSNGACGGSGLTLDTNSVANASQTALNLETSTANLDGLIITPSSSSGGIEKFEITGTYSGSIASQLGSPGHIGGTIAGEVDSTFLTESTCATATTITVPCVVTEAVVPSQTTASGSTTTVFTTSTAGLYRVTGSCYATTASSAAWVVYAFVSTTETGMANSPWLPPIGSCTVGTSPGYNTANTTQLLNLASGVAVKVGTQTTSGSNTGGVFTYSYAIERLN